mmetsp:Transcript_13376/g.35597  ORF Transcript_13376/g.35597 Transcript_13376/m.35597 type:complete len:195 (-) Transcript_13376:97-681(-)
MSKGWRGGAGLWHCFVAVLRCRTIDRSLHKSRQSSYPFIRSTRSTHLPPNLHLTSPQIVNIREPEANMYAFVISVPIAGAFDPSTAKLAPRTRPSTSREARSAPTMVQDSSKVPLKKDPMEKPRFNAIAENRKAILEAEERGPQGFTKYAEKVNGRLAMMGFAIGLVTEVVNKTHPTIYDQMLTIFPITKLLNL